MIELIYQNRLLSTLALTTLMILVKYSLVSFVRSRAKKKKQDKRYLVSNIKNLLNFVLIVLLLSFWINEIQNFALSIAAFAVAIVLATREFIQCIIGFFYLMSTRPFRIGDWIQVDGFAGEVSATDWIKSTLLEVDLSRYHYTGKTLFIPNNKLISSPIKNLNFLKRYVTHHFTITRDEDVNPYLIIEQLRQRAKEQCADFYDVAARYNQIIERRLDVKIEGPEPRIEVSTNDVGHTQIRCTIFCPTERALEIEQKIIASFMDLWFTEFNKPQEFKY
ncbi:mechanosensitive ion channel family protein [Aliiglaciecola sp. LCG003]|uniref:mechanosensitive ion channel family protein n=1 Tax=Aliiglaciecola sp. LCG003 TaxID=3053655 RepID=UPI00257447BC|nr:mechanosensitive ion channel family protein [Aliiglaciecola sp. LCG003]WJG09083.1 mechanosensitive ion channel family protein [Aliiglaciecola sp. LCG003]